MKKKLFFILALTATAGMFSACSEMQIIQDELHEICFDSYVEVPTKGPISGTYPENSTGTFLLSAYHSGVGNYFTDIPFNYYQPAGRSYGWHGGSSGSENLKFWPHNGSMNFIALRKGSLGNAPGHGGNVAASVTYAMPKNDSAQEDVMVAYTEGVGCPSGSPVSLNFKHAQAQIAVKASCGVNDPTSNHGITVTSITLNNAKYSGTFTATGTSGNNVSFVWSSQGDADNKSFGATSTRLSSSSSYCGTSGIMVPAQAPSGVSITIGYTLHNGKTAGGVDENIANLSYTYNIQTASWDPGLVYTYDFTFTLSEITCSASVAGWGDGSGANPSI